MMVDSMAFQLQIRATDSATLVYPKRKIYMYSTHGCYELGDIRSGSMSGDDSFLKFNCSHPQRYNTYSRETKVYFYFIHTKK
ncbi:Uncharacterized protein BM_BM2520 [Brugia malayi]|uniref:Bm2520, isoform b n=1 Tax=Brugia malayi TaxID=6279 RepID=A0A0K0J6C3_BRUMA|nr:Uncharacterized protein BM_BM2520 [Brugia malayi]CDQ02743.1 Bm2520, isoform b [Brugia malayi]VIO96733.1 Uncharacterized protein BM_BM2520 [Brugia malayi]